MGSLIVNIAGAVITVALFVFVSPVVGIIAGLVFGIVAIRIGRLRTQ